MNKSINLKSLETTFNNAVKNQQNSNFDIAEDEYLQCLSLEYRLFDVLKNLGYLYLSTENYQKAETVYLNMISIKNDYVDAYLQLGDIYLSQEEAQKAVDYYEVALSLEPCPVGIYVNLGVLYRKLNNIDVCISMYLDGLLIFNDNELLYSNLSNVMRSNHLPQRFKKKDSTQKVLSSCLLYKNNEYQKFLNIILTFLFDKYELDAINFDNDGSYLLLENQLFQLSLRKMIMSNPELESFLVKIRKEILNKILSDKYTKKQILKLKDFISSLSIQCFYTEYVYITDDEEYELLKQLELLILKSLKQKDTKALVYIALYGAYEPLHSKAFCENKFFIQEKEKDSVMRELYKIQIQEPKIEKELSKITKCLKTLEDEVTQQVASQYEQNPYPRWNSLRKTTPTSLANYIKAQLPLLKQLSDENKPCSTIEILIAGSGTGRHPISTSNLIENSNVTAIDLSKASISYAKRKAQEMGVKNLEFVQANILDLKLMNKKFDLIESVGVLHHMEHPIKGWEVLKDILNSGGYMKIGLYSEMARKSIVDTISFVEEKGYEAKIKDIRQCRDDIRKLDKLHSMRTLEQYIDFYSISGARDLIFNVQEHRFTIPEIQKNLNDLNLEFLGFSFQERSIYERYLQMFPDDQEAKSLKNWHEFEFQYPNTFIEMYQMWLQKA